MTTPDDLVALRTALAAACAEAKAAFPGRDHSAIDGIAATLDTISGDMVPDFASLDRHGAVSRMFREAAHHLAEFGRPEFADAAGLIRADLMFIDALRIRDIEMLAHRNQRTLDRKRLHDA